jgi:hypothetical protein
MIALTIAGIASITMLGALRDATHSLALLETRRLTLRDAERFLVAVSLWPRADLERRLGTRPQGPYLLTITMTTGTLFEIGLADRATRAPLLSTVLYRPTGN